MRPSWDQYFLTLADHVASRSTCPRLLVGAVLIKDRYIISTGYNGAPPGQNHCTDVGCTLIDNHCTTAIHAEDNAILHCKTDLRYSTIYITHNPCSKCIVKIYDAGIKRIVYSTLYKPIDYKFVLGVSDNQLPEIIHYQPNKNLDC